MIKITYIQVGRSQGLISIVNYKKFEALINQLGPLRITTETLSTAFSERAQLLYSIYFNNLPPQTRGTVGGVEITPPPIVVVEIDDNIVYMEAVFIASADKIRDIINNSGESTTTTTVGDTIMNMTPVQASAGLPIILIGLLILFGRKSTK